MQFLLFAISAAVAVTALPQVLVELDLPKPTKLSNTSDPNYPVTPLDPIVCTKVIDVVGDVGARGCWGIAQDNHIPFHNVMAWNSVVGDYCSNLRLGQMLCVEKRASCAKYGQVPREEMTGCGNVVQLYGLKNNQVLEKLNPWIDCASGRGLLKDDYVCVAPAGLIY